MATVIPLDSSREEIFEQVAHVESLRKLENSRHSSTLPKVLQGSRVVELLTKYVKEEPLFALAEKHQEIGKSLKSYMQDENLKMLETIRKEFPDKTIHLVHLPEKEEVEAKNYEVEVAEIASDLDVNYFPALKACDWSIDLFHPNDTHPNKAGYKRVTDCVEQYLFAKRTR